MELKKELFFDGDEVNMSKLMSFLTQHPNDSEKILKYVFDKIECLTEFKVKKENLKERYDHKLNELYAEYMTED